MTKNEIRVISLKYRTLAAQMLKVDSQNDMNYVKMFLDFVTDTAFINAYIVNCHKNNYDFDKIISNKSWNEPFNIPSNTEDMIDFDYQLLRYIVDNKKTLYSVGGAYSNSNSIKDIISAFIRKVFEPFINSIRTYLEISMINLDGSTEPEENANKLIFLSYCQKDSDIADLVEESIADRIKDNARLSRDIRDVEYHQSFKAFMQSISNHDYVIMIISDNYLKSQNCMYEVMEVIKDSNYGKKLAFLVLSNADSQYYKAEVDNIGADIYSDSGQTKYSLYWKNKESELQNSIDEIGQPEFAINQIKSKRQVTRILLDLPAFLEYLRDIKGLSLTQHIEENFKSLLTFMDIDA